MLPGLAVDRAATGRMYVFCTKSSPGKEGEGVRSGAAEIYPTSTHTLSPNTANFRQGTMGLLLIHTKASYMSGD